jgi:hypothetical protein
VKINPIVVIQMKVTPAIGIPFDGMAQIMVSRIAIPHAGDNNVFIPPKLKSPAP